MTRRSGPGFGGGAPLFPLAVLAVLQLLDQATQSAFGVLIPNVRDAFGLSDTEILLIVALAGAAALLGTVPVAWLADRRRRVPIVLVGAGAGAMFSVALGVSPTAVVMAVMLCGVYLGQAVIFPAHNSLIADYYPVSSRPGVYSVHRAGLSLGAVTGVLAGAGLTAAFSWRVPFVVFALPILVVVGIGARLREPPRGRHERDAFAAANDDGPASPSSAEDEVEAEPPPSFGEAWRMVWKIGVLRRIFFALPFLAAAVAGFGSLAALQYQQTFHLGVVTRAYLVAPVQVFVLLGLVIGATVGTRLAARRLPLVFVMLAVASVVASGFAVLFALAPSVPVAFFADAGIEASLAVVGPGVLAALSLAVPARARAVGFSLGALFVVPGLVVIPLVGAVGDVVGFRYGMLVLVPVFLVGGLVVASAGRLIENDVANVWLSVRVRHDMRAARARGELPLLAVRGLRVGYEGVAVVHGVDFEIAEGEIVAVVGTNGAGKSTLLRAFGGVTEADDGAVVFDGRDITHMPPDEIARLGVGLMPGGAGVFPTLSVEENLRAAAWQLRGRRRQLAGQVDDALERFAALAERRADRAGDLSGGQQQMLALAMALLSGPRLLLLDELSLGLAPIVVEQLLESVRALRDAGTAVVLVEQSVTMALAVADRIYVMDGGVVRFSGTADEVRARPDLLRSIFLHHAAASVDTAGAPVDVAVAPSASPGGPALEVRAVSVTFGGIAAVTEVSLTAAPGEVVGVIGPNGAGKTTLFDVISGFLRPGAGRVLLGGTDVTDLAAATRARRGLGRSFQDSRLFGALSVRDTLAVALERFIDAADPLNAALRLPVAVDTEAAVTARVEELMELFGLEGYAEAFVSELSTGTRRLVDLAGVVAHAPSVVLLDEPTSGVAEREIEAMGGLLDAVRRRLGATMVIVEHNIGFVAAVADRLVALDQGRVLAEGTPAAVLDRVEVAEAFLGTGDPLLLRSGPTAPIEGDR